MILDHGVFNGQSEKWGKPPEHVVYLAERGSLGLEKAKYQPARMISQDSTDKDAEWPMVTGSDSLYSAGITRLYASTQNSSMEKNAGSSVSKRGFVCYL